MNQLLFFVAFAFYFLREQKDGQLLQKVTKDRPFKIVHSDKSVVDKRRRKFIFTGNVSMQIFADTVLCDSAILNYKKLTVTVYGHIRQMPLNKVNIPGWNGDGQVYYLKEGLVVGAGPAY